MALNIDEIDAKGDTLLVLEGYNASLVEDTTPAIRMRLSSKHLTSASEYFRAAFAHDYMETKVESGYTYTITAQGWDQEALRLIMNIIHGQTQNVPQKVSLEMLAKIAAIVDYYKCRNAIHFFLQTWVKNLAGPFPSSYGFDLLLRLFISRLTKTVILESRGPIHDLGLPPLSHITDSLDKIRQDLVSEIISSLDALLSSFLQDEGECSFECSCIMLGALTRGMYASNILQQRPEPPFYGFSVAALSEMLRTLRSPRWFTSQRDPRPHTCSLSAKIEPILDDIKNRVEGLKWNEFFQLQ
ncbi:hypothetical protein LZ32DRAFT_633432 [Colletotrichum eremochloae]|nr:hypothetical protein LZ32DRAFT_633432 [Colletotrichum eremochloae]